MDNVRVKIFMAGVVALILAVTIGTLIRRLEPGEEAPHGPGTGWLQTTMLRWRDALQLALRCPWILALPFVIGAIEAIAPCLWTHHLWSEGGNAVYDMPSLAELIRCLRQFHPKPAAFSALRAGSIQVGAVWTGAVVLVVGLWALAKRRASALVWLVWALLTTGMVFIAWFALAGLSSDRSWAHTVVSRLALMGVGALVGGLILLALRRAARQRRACDVSIVDELARFWPEWFLLAFLASLPMSVFRLVSTLATSDSIPAEPQSWLMAAAHNEWARGGTTWTAWLLSLALLFAPYALAAKACSAGEAARDSLRIWREGAPEVLRLLAPLWCLGIVLYVVLLLCPSGPSRFLSPFSTVGLVTMTVFWMGRSLTVAFRLFAEIVCLQWYESAAVSMPQGEAMEGEHDGLPPDGGDVREGSGSEPE